MDRRPGRECLDKGLLHRAIVAFVSNSKGEIYLQKRANDRRFYPGFWTASCTGHVSAGESYIVGARREIREEPGIECDILPLGKFITPRWKIPGGTEWEYITVFEGTSDKSITLSNESQEGRFVSVAEFATMMSARPAIVTPDTLLSLEFYQKAR